MEIRQKIDRAVARVRDIIRRVRDEEAIHASFWIRWTRNQIDTYWFVIKDLYKERGLREAAALTYTTLLSIVPMLAVAFSLFKAFNAFEGLEDKVEQAIFDKLLSPFVTTLSPADATTQAERVKIPSPDTLTEAEKQEQALQAFQMAEELPRSGYSRQAFSLYAKALALGYDAEACRGGMSRIYLRSIPHHTLERILSELQSGAVRRYREAAGLPVDPPEKAGRNGDNGKENDGDEHSEDGEPSDPSTADVEDLMQRVRQLRVEGELGEALGLVDQAEQQEAPPAATRLMRARIYAALAGTVKDYDQAIQNYQDALTLTTDIFVLFRDHWRPQMFRDIVSEHDKYLTQMARLKFDQGSRLLSKYKLQREESPEESRRLLDQAIKLLTDAALILDKASDVQLNLAEALYARDDHEEARTHYLAAYRTANERAAKGFSSAIVETLRRFIGKVNTAGIGVIGVLFLVVTSMSLLSTIEKTFNQIWHVESRRPYWIKFTSFFTFLWLAPVLIAVSIWARERIESQVAPAMTDIWAISELYRFGARAVGYVAPVITVWLVLTAMYKFLPHTKVRIRHAMWGALLSALLLQLVRPLFVLYLRNAVRPQQIYGSLGAIPVFLLWIWLLWVIVLFGAEVTYVSQNIQTLRLREKMSRLSAVLIDRFLATRLMFYIALDFYQGKGAAEVATLAKRLDTTEHEILNACERLMERKQLIPANDEHSEYLPSRDLADIRVFNVLEINAEFRDEYRSNLEEDKQYEKRLDALFDSIEESERKALQEMTLYDLVSQFRPEETPEKKPQPAGGEA